LWQTFGRPFKDVCEPMKRKNERGKNSRPMSVKERNIISKSIFFGATDGYFFSYKK
jgi:hypothetical protein